MLLSRLFSRLFIGTIITFSCIFPTFADNFDHILDNDGNPILNVRQMLFDEQGYLWYGGDDGVYRFDGYQLTRVNNEPTGHLFLDQQNRFWSSGTTTLLALSKDDYSTVEYPNLSTNEIKPEHELTYQMYQTDTGRQFFATKEGLSEYFYQQDSFDHYDITTPKHEYKLSVTALLKTGSNQLLLGTNKGLYQIPLSSINGTSKTLTLGDPLLDNFTISTLNLHRENLYVGTGNGLYVIDAKGNISEHYFHQANDEQTLTHNKITSVLIDDQNYLWVGTHQGLNRKAPGSQQFKRFYQNDSDSSSITNNMITDLHQDQHNNIIIATYSGINRFHHNDVHLYPLLGLKALEHSVNNVWSMAEDSNNNLWVGTFGSGLIRLNADGSARQFTNETGVTNSLASNRIPSLYIDKDNQLLVGTNRGLQRFDALSQSFQLVVLENAQGEQKNTRQIFDISEGIDGHLWLATDKGIIELDTQRVAHFYDKHSKQRIQYKQWVRSVFALDHRILVGSDKGLHIIDTRADTVSLLEQAGRVLKIYPDSQNNIWVIGLDDVMVFDRHNNQVQSLNQPPSNPFDNGKAQLGCNSATEDQQLQLWLVCGSGIKVVDINKKQLIAKYGKQDKVDMSSFLTGSVSMITSSTGHILMGERSGITQFNPTPQARIVGQSNLVLSHVEASFTQGYQQQSDSFNQPFLFAKTTSSAAPTPQTLVHYGIQKLEFQFSALDMARPKATHYRYRLEGYDHDWNLTKADNRRAIYTNLPAGKYNFKVEAKAFGQPISKLNYSFAIAPKPWQTWWAYCLYFMAAMLSIYTIILLRTKALKQRQFELEHRIFERTSELRDSKQEIEQLMRERQKLIENIYHQTRTPLQIMQGNINSLTEKQLTVKQYAQKQSEKIDDLVNLTDQILDVSRVSQISQESLELVNLSTLLRPIAISFNDVAKSQNIEFKWQISDDIYIKGSKPSMENVFDNLLSNAIKYTESGSIAIEATLEQAQGQEQAVIRCVDTGIGIPQDDQQKVFMRYHRASNSKSQQGAGIGLAMVKDVIESIKGKIDLTSQEQQGTTITISIPAQIAPEKVAPEKVAPEKVAPQTDDVNQVQEQENTTSIDAADNKETTSKPSILIVEDNQELSQYIVNLLEPLYQPTTAESGKQGFAIAKQNVPDVILSDVMMEDGDGYQFVKSIRKDEITCHIPILLVTAKSDNASQEQGYALGASDFITKPFKAHDLLNRISNQLKHIRAIQKRLRPIEQAPTEIIDPEEDRLITRYLTFVANNYQYNNLKIKDICEQLHISIRQLERKVRHFLDMTPNELLNDYRLSRAKELLEQGKSVSQVYEHCGFSSHAYFSKRYKEKFGHLPSQFKKQKAKQHRSG